MAGGRKTRVMERRLAPRARDVLCGCGQRRMMLRVERIKVKGYHLIAVGLFMPRPVKHFQSAPHDRMVKPVGEHVAPFVGQGVQPKAIVWAGVGVAAIPNLDLAVDKRVEIRYSGDPYAGPNNCFWLHPLPDERRYMLPHGFYHTVIACRFEMFNLVRHE